MGKGLVNLPDGVDFGPEHFGSEMSKNFGFSGSSEGGEGVPAVSPKPTMGGHAPQNFAHGGSVHPMGHDVANVEHGPHGTITRHKHGGFSHQHPDGSMTHHGADGMPMSAGPSAINGGAGPGEGTLVGKMMGGGEPDGDEAMARGGRAVRIPQSMKPKGASNHSPINSAPRNPTRSVSPRNKMPGGEMPYGVEPSSEPDQAGTEQGIPQLAKGGRMRDNC